jgi:hypothetical protein
MIAVKMSLATSISYAEGFIDGMIEAENNKKSLI